MERTVQVHVLADDPRDRAAWVAALARMSALQIVGVGPFGSVEVTDDGNSVVLVIGVDDASMDAHEVVRELARHGASIVVLEGVDATLFFHASLREEAIGEYGIVPVVTRISADSSPDRVAAAVVALGFGLEVSDPLLADPWSPEDAFTDRDDATAETSDGVRADPTFEGGTGDPEPLTGRERDVLEELVHGSTNRQIADALGITENTVKFHVASLLSKFGASTRTDLVVRAIQAGTLRV